MRTPTRKTLSTVVATALVVLGSLLVTVVSNASGPLDQSQPSVDQRSSVGQNYQSFQFFVAGVSGAMDQVDLLLRRDPFCSPGDFVLEVRDLGPGGIPGSTLLATSVVSATSISSTEAWVPIRLIPAVPVTANEGYTITLATQASMSCLFYGWSTGNPYPLGFMGASSDSGATWTIFGSWDLAFQTYVSNPATVHDVSVFKSGPGTGSVTTSPAGIDCGATCDAEFAYGTDVALTATPDAGWRVGAWTGCDTVVEDVCTLLALSAARAAYVSFVFDVDQVEITFDLTPKAKTRKRGATFEFHASEGGVTFECGLDGQGFTACTSPVVFERLSRRTVHTFEVRVTDGVDVGDPESYSWKVRRKRR